MTIKTLNMNNRKLVRGFLTFLMLVALMPVWGAGKLTFDKSKPLSYGGLKYSGIVYAVGSEVATKLTVVGVADTKLTDVDIPSTFTTTIDGYEYVGEVEKIGSNAFKDNAVIKSVSVPSTITEIEGSAFINCANLTKVNLENATSLTVINNFAFNSIAQNVSVTEPIVIPSSVTRIGYGAFAMKWKVNDTVIVASHALIDLSNATGLITIHQAAFAGCQLIGTSTGKISFSENLNTINPYAFALTNIESVDFSQASGLKTLNANAFADCDGLQTVDLRPATALTTLGQNAFTGSALETIMIPTTLTTLKEQDCAVSVPATYYSQFAAKVKSTLIKEYVSTGSTGWTTACLGSDAEIPVGTKAYYVSGIEGDVLTLTEIESGKIPANVGFIFNATHGQYILEPAENVEALSDNMLNAAMADTKVTAESAYVLSKLANGNVGFQLYQGTTIPRGKAYLPKTAVADSVKATSLRFAFGPSTGIESVEAGTSGGDIRIYDMQGREVQNMQRGQMYIINNKKVIVK